METPNNVMAREYLTMPPGVTLDTPSARGLNEPDTMCFRIHGWGAFVSIQDDQCYTSMTLEPVGFGFHAIGVLH